MIEAEQTLDNMLSWPENWNGQGSDKPDIGAIGRARHLIRSYRTMAGSRWSEPHTTASATGSVVLEWWHDERKLTVYVSIRSANFVKVWGADMDSEMEDGDMGDFLPLWQWLTFG